MVSALSSCSKLNSVQVRALLTPLAPPEVIEAGVAHAARLADELCRADGRGVRLEESGWLCVDLMIPCDGFSAEVSLRLVFNHLPFVSHYWLRLLVMFSRMH